MSKQKLRSRLSKLWRSARGFFSPLQVEDRWFTPEPTEMERYMSEHQPLLPPLQFRVSDDEVHRRNERRLELMRLDQERDAVNKNLKAQHRLMVVTVLTALVALLSSTVAVYASLHSKPPIVNVTPHVIVK